jgi:4-oxalocrotonate tautomerase
MPLVRVDTNAPPGSGLARRAGDLVHRALVEALGVPAGDRFQVLTDGGPGTVACDPHYLDIHRSDGIICIQITLARGRTTDQKKALYARIADLLHDELDLRRDDILINLIEVTPQDWSFGRGEAQFADDLPPHLRQLAT